MDQGAARPDGAVRGVVHVGVCQQAPDQAGAGALPLCEPDEHPAHLQLPAQAAHGGPAEELRAAQQGESGV